MHFFLTRGYHRRLRDKTEVVYVTPRSGVFTQPTAARVLGHLIEKKRIKVVTDFHISRVDNDRHKIISWGGKDVDYDLLVTVPTNTGDVAMGRSGLAHELNFVATNRHTLQSKQHPNIFVLGDATDLLSSKFSSLAYFQSEVLTENILHQINGEPLESQLDGHARRIDFNYKLQTLDGKYRLPVLGQFSSEADLDCFASSPLGGSMDPVGQKRGDAGNWRSHEPTRKGKTQALQCAYAE